MEMEREELKRRFDELLPRYERLKEEAKFILEEALQTRAIKVHSIQCRIKEFDSFLEKAERKQCADPFQAVHDICGLRVVCLFLSDLGRIAEAIRESFGVIAEDNRVERPDVSSFGYSDVQFVATMRDSYKGPRYDNIAGLKFEIQVATIAMHAWASISHYLDYKSDVDIPSELRRDFYALSGLFYVADTHFEMFFHAREESRRETVKAFKGSRLPVDAEINLDTLTAYLHWKFKDRIHESSRSLSDFVQGLIASGYKTIGQLDIAVDQGSAKPKKLEEDLRKETLKNESFALMDVSFAQIALSSVDAEFAKIIKDVMAHRAHEEPGTKELGS
jgi:ppGpp synthetase/RelA/SpoT-type nucleotidyltranferase